MIDVTVYQNFLMGYSGLPWEECVPFYNIPGEVGVTIYSPSYACSFAVKNYPLIRSVTNYWFGPSENLSTNFWNQSTEQLWEPVNVSTGCLWSWQRVSIPPMGTATFASLVKAGLWNKTQPILTLNSADIDYAVLPSDPVYISGSISNSAGSDLILVIDSDLSRILNVIESVRSSYSKELKLSDYGIGIGQHELLFFAVDRADGRISDERRIPLIVGDRPIAPPPAQPCDLLIGRGTSGPEVFLINATGAVFNTSNGAGYTVRIRSATGQLSSAPPAFQSLTFSNVRFQAHVRPLSARAALFIVELENELASVQKGTNVEVDADIWFTGFQEAVWNFDPQIGFTMQSIPGHYGVSFILKDYPLIRNSVTVTYWIGPGASRANSYWT
jgi:hypothetical protein